MPNIPPKSSPYTLSRCIWDIISQFPNQILTFLNAPGFIRGIEYPDRVTGDYISIRVNKRFTVISVNNRDYYFRRLTGKFDGTGYVVRRSTIQEQLCCILDHTPESTRPLSLWGRLKELLLSIDWGYSP